MEKHHLDIVTNGGAESKVTSSNVGGNVSVLLEPGEKVLAQIVASRINAKVKIEYESYLTGEVALNYNTPHKGHHFWNWKVESILEQNKQMNSCITIEMISIELHCNMKLKLIKVKH